MAYSGSLDNTLKKCTGKVKDQRSEDEEKKPKATKFSETARYIYVIPWRGPHHSAMYGVELVLSNGIILMFLGLFY